VILCTVVVRNISGFQAFRLSGFQAFRLSGFQAFRLSGFQAFRLSGFHSLIRINEYVKHVHFSLGSVVIPLLFSRSCHRLALGTRRFLSILIGIILISSSLAAVAIEEPQEPSVTPLVNPQPSSQPTAPVQNAVEEFLTKEIADVLQHPDIVESYLVEPELDLNVSDKCQLAGFRIAQNGTKLTAEQIEQFKAIVSDNKSYATSIKKCVFRPELGLLFKKGKQQVEFLLSMGCDKWLFVSADQRKQGDYRDSAKASLLKLRDTLFPVKSD